MNPAYWHFILVTFTRSIQSHTFQSLYGVTFSHSLPLPQTLSCLTATQEVAGIFLAIVNMNFLCNLDNTYMSGDQGHRRERGGGGGSNSSNREAMVGGEEEGSGWGWPSPVQICE